MKLKTFNANDMQEALSIARDVLGDEAIIISSTPQPGGKGVQVTVAIETPADESELDDFSEEDNYEEEIASNPVQNAAAYSSYTKKAHPAPAKDTQDDYSTLPITAKERALSDIEQILTYHGVPQKLMHKLLKRAGTQSATTAASVGELQAQITQLLDIYFTFDDTILDIPSSYMLVGPAGAGKTLTIAKMAAQLTMNKKSCIVITTDTKQAGSVEQLQAFTDILGLELLLATTRGELREHVKAAPPDAMVLIDSFGSNPYDFQEMKELGEFASLQDVEPILVVPAGMHESEAEEIARVYRFLDIEKMMVTRTDAARRFGSILAASSAGNLALTYVSSGSKVSADFRPLDAIALGQILVQCKKDNAMNFNEGNE